MKGFITWTALTAKEGCTSCYSSNVTMSSTDKDRIKLQKKAKAAGYIGNVAGVANIAGNLIPGVGVLGGVMDEVANHLDPQVRQSHLEEELDKRFQANRASRKERLDDMEKELDKKLNRELDKMKVSCNTSTTCARNE